MDVGNSKETIILSNEIYRCYRDLERQLSCGVESFSKLFKVYLRNNDVDRIHLVNDIIINQQFHINNIRSFMTDWSVF